MIKSASFDFHKAHRYSLYRQWDRTKRFMVMVGLNPSVADAQTDDQTIRRGMHFARREDCGGLYMVNLHTVIATDPKDLWLYLGGHGEQIARWLSPRTHLGGAMNMGGLIVPAWGGFRGEPIVRQRFLELFGQKDLFCLGRTKSGAPRHPSRLPNAQKLERFN